MILNIFLAITAVCNKIVILWRKNFTVKQIYAEFFPISPF